MPGAGHQTVEGEYHYIWYRTPETASNPQIQRNMGTALRNAGYTMVYEAQGHDTYVGHMGKTWIQIYITSNGEIAEHIVTETKLTQDVVANAAALSSGISANGHIVVTGILFDTAKADVKAESKPALDEVVKMLKENASLKVYVVATRTTLALWQATWIYRSAGGCGGSGTDHKVWNCRRAAGALRRRTLCADRLQRQRRRRALNRRVELVKQ